MFFAKICSPWREMLIQSYKVPKGQLDSVARRMSFLKDKLKDWCYQASIQKNMKRLRGEDHGGPNSRPEPTNLDRGSDQQGFHPKDLDEQIPDPQDEPLQEELSDGPIPEPTKISKTAIAGPAEQRVTYLQTARRNVVNYANLKPRMTSLMQSIMAIWMTVSNKTMERIMHQDSNLSPYDGFRIGGIGGVLNQIGLNQRRHHIIYKVSSGEFAIPMKLTGNVMEMQLIPKEEILEELNQDFSRVLTLHQDFKRKDLMKEGNRPYSITYRIAYALSNTHHYDLFLRKEYIEIPRIFKKFAKVMTADPIKIPRIGGVDLVIKDHPVLERKLSTKTEFSSIISFSEDRIVGYRGKKKELIKIFTPQEIRVDNQPVIGRYEGMLEIAGHEILVAGVARKENGNMTLGLNFLEDHKPWGRKGSGICTAKPGVFPKKAMETLPVIAGRNFSQKILILNKGIREAKIMIGGAFGSPWFRDNNRNLLIFTTNCGSEIQVMRRDKAFNRIMPINFHSKRGDFDAKLIHPKMQDKRKFGKALWSFRQQGFIESDSFYKESEKEIINLKEALQEIKSLDISEESRLSLENVKRLIQRNFSENPLVWWDRNKIEATLKVKEECKYEYVRYKPIQMNMNDKKDMQRIIKEHINLGLIEPRVSAYSSPGFLVRNHGEIKRGIFIKDLAKYRKDFRPLLKETESSKWKWEEIHTQRVRELKQVCSNLPKLAIPQDEDELVVYTDANDYQWAALLMKRTSTGEEPCRYTGGLFSEQQAQTTIRSSLVASTALWNALQEPIQKASPSVMTRELREHDPKHALRVHGSRPIATDSSTACTRPSPDSGEKVAIESQGVQTSDDSSQPSTSGVKEEGISLRPMTGTSKANTNEFISSSSAWQVYQQMWEKLISRKGINPSKTIVETSGRYNRV
ncbi:UNVERIFIED_CONTAM: movement protein [Sesamum latifolium]|uniref:Movement protein n=1 Tax=Sesamum latifolium TaxID=2727402 RepID=A0AAW2XX72_9LAMI